MIYFKTKNLFFPHPFSVGHKSKHVWLDPVLVAGSAPTKIIDNFKKQNIICILKELESFNFIKPINYLNYLPKSSNFSTTSVFPFEIATWSAVFCPFEILACNNFALFLTRYSHAKAPFSFWAAK